MPTSVAEEHALSFSQVGQRDTGVCNGPLPCISALEVLGVGSFAGLKAFLSAFPFLDVVGPLL